MGVAQIKQSSLVVGSATVEEGTMYQRSWNTFTLAVMGM